MRRAMRILYYSPHPDLRLGSLTGYGTHMREMIRAFERLGHAVTPLIMGDRGAAGDGVGPAPAVGRRFLRRIVPGPLWEGLRDRRLLLLDRRFRKTLDEAIAVEKPDLLYERANYLQVSGVEAAAAAGIPHVLEVNAPYLEERIALSRRPLGMRAARRNERRQLGSRALLAVVSSDLQEYCCRRGADPERTVVVPNAIDPDDTAVDPEVVARLRERLDLGERAVVGFVGTLMPWHGVDRLIEAVAGDPRLKRGAALLIVGDGAGRNALERLAAGVGIADRVRFVGSVGRDEVFAHIACMDIAVMPDSNWYGSPVKIFEYGALGRPIVAPDLGPLRDVMVDGEDGLLIEPSRDALAAALRCLIDDPARAAAMGRAFRAKVLEWHTWLSNARRILRCVEERWG